MPIEARAEAQLQQTLRRLRIHLQRTPVAVVEWDADARIIGWNPAAEQMFGWSADEAIGRRVGELGMLHPDDAPRVERLMAGMVAGGRQTESRNRNRRKDGTVLHCEWYNSALFDDAGSLVSVLSLGLDVSDRVRAEQALRECDRRKDEFLAALSHELRNPLAPIGSALHLLAQSDLSGDSARRAREIMERQLRHLKRLVGDLLDVSRITRGSVELHAEELDLVTLVRDTVEDHRGMLAQAGLRVEVDVPPEPLPMSGDPTRLAQILSNLLANAAKFTPRGGEVSITLSRAAPDVALLAVRDDGEGIDAATLARVFEPFSQADRSLARRRGGLGLGLTVVKGLVELHGGSVSVASPGVGAGTEVSIRLPIAPAARAMPSPRPAPPSRPTRILVIEDNADAAETLRLALEIEGHEVAVAYDGEAGLEAARASRPDIAICDIGLPAPLDGYQVAREIRGDPALRSMPLVALTGYAGPDDQRRAKEAGFDLHFAKPADLSSLLGAIGDLVVL